MRLPGTLQNFGDSLWYADALAQKARWGYQVKVALSLLGSQQAISKVYALYGHL